MSTASPPLQPSMGPNAPLDLPGAPFLFCAALLTAAIGLARRAAERARRAAASGPAPAPAAPPVVG
jgi:hypothetical protein